MSAFVDAALTIDHGDEPAQRSADAAEPPSKDRRRGGRPSKRNSVTALRVLESVRVGLTFKMAAAHAGISYDTLHDWRKADLAFDAAVRHAAAMGVVALLERVESGAQQGDWRAAAWLLSHRHPDAYGRSPVGDTAPGCDHDFVEIREVTVRVAEDKTRTCGQTRGSNLEKPIEHGETGKTQSNTPSPAEFGAAVRQGAASAAFRQSNTSLATPR